MKNLTIGQKIAGGFTAIILIAAIVGGLASLTMNRVRDDAKQMNTEFVPEARIGTDVQTAVAQTQLAARSYGLTDEDKYLKQAKEGLAAIDQQVVKARELVDQHPNLVKLRTHLTDFEAALKDYKAALGATEESNEALAAHRNQLNTAAAAFVGNLDKLIEGQNERLDREVKDFVAADKLAERHRKISLANDIREHGNAARISAFKSQALRNPAVMAEGLKQFDEMDQAFDELKGLIKTPADIEELAKARAAATTYRETMGKIMQGLTNLDEIAKRRAAAGVRLDASAGEIATAGMQRTVTAADDSSTLLTKASRIVQVMVASAIALGLVVAFFIIRGITRVLRATTDSLINGSAQIVSAATQVSTSSQSLASGASEQAASLEETSASIEELNSMTRDNSENADRARVIAESARQSADQGASAVTNLNTAMAELKSSNTEVAKIVKSIDEIAFQTNILALNAAVEAARAGEAGAGFAVVADEVRNLAQRSAQAAKETADKIEHALTKSNDGARISAEVNASLTGIIEQVRKLGTIVNDIANASKEQSKGISQVNDAVVQIDKVTQSNAAAAEESASAAEELNAQAAEFNTLVGNLLTLVGGRRDTDAKGVPGEVLPNGSRHSDVATSPKKTPKPAPKAPAAKAPAVSAANGRHRPSGKVEVSAEQEAEMAGFFK